MIDLTHEREHMAGMILADGIKALTFDTGGTILDWHLLEDDVETCERNAARRYDGFCGNRITNVWKQVADTDDSLVRLAAINEVEKCPSGALTYSIDGDEIEQLLPEAVSIIDDGPIWVTGGVAISSSDGRRLETRNRVTLCRCGASANKPLCDGSHKNVGFSDH